MRKHYDFSNAEQGKPYRSAKALRIPVYLDDDVHRKLAVKGRRNSDLSKLVNAILRSELGVAEMLK